LEACPTFGGLNAIRLISGLGDFFVGWVEHSRDFL